MAESAELLVISQLPPPVHGSTVMTATLMTVLKRSGFRTVLVDRRFSNQVSDIGKTNIWKIAQAFGLVTRLFRASLSRTSGAAIFFTTNRAPSFFVDVLLSLVLRVTRTPYIAYVHTNGYSALAERSALHHRGMSQLLGSADLVVVLGESMRRDVAPFARRVVIIENALPDDDEGAIARDPDRGGNVLFMSNLLPGKGAEDFIRAAAVCLEELPGSSAMIVGGTDDARYGGDLESMSETLAGARIEFRGAVHGAEKSRLLRGADVLLFTSTYQYEAQPLTILEALRAGTPVVAYDVGGIKDVVVDGVNGHLVEPGNWRAAAERAIDLMRSAERRSVFSAAARRTYVERFALPHFEGAWRAVLGETIPR